MAAENLDVVRRGYDAFGRGDIPALLELFDEQIRWVTPGPPELATSGNRVGRHAVTEFFGTLNQLFDIERFEPKEFIAQGDRVVVLGEETTRVKSTGKVVDLDWVHVFKLRDGRVTAFQDFYDTAVIVAAMTAAHAAA